MYAFIYLYIYTYIYIYPTRLCPLCYSTGSNAARAGRALHVRFVGGPLCAPRLHYQPVALVGRRRRATHEPRPARRPVDPPRPTYQGLTFTRYCQG